MVESPDLFADYDRALSDEGKLNGLVTGVMLIGILKQLLNLRIW